MLTENNIRAFILSQMESDPYPQKIRNYLSVFEGEELPVGILQISMIKEISPSIVIDANKLSDTVIELRIWWSQGSVRIPDANNFTLEAFDRVNQHWFELRDQRNNRRKEILQNDKAIQHLTFCINQMLTAEKECHSFLLFDFKNLLSFCEKHEYMSDIMTEEERDVSSPMGEIK